MKAWGRGVRRESRRERTHVGGDLSQHKKKSWRHDPGGETRLGRNRAGHAGHRGSTCGQHSSPHFTSIPNPLSEKNKQKEADLFRQVGSPVVSH